ncbi:hypothetical protein FACS189419_01590 [Planctomycetales bacterium]|nr:hypothetical protein FACS189419_01590 [Planctomycetales bacterium]
MKDILIYLVLFIFGIMPAALVLLFKFWFLPANRRAFEAVKQQSKTWTICPHCGELVWLQTFRCSFCQTENEVMPALVNGGEKIAEFKQCVNCRQPLPAVHFDGRERLTAVCPKCSQNIGSQAGIYQEIVIPVLGSSQTGKSAYLAALIYRLQQRFGSRLTFPFPGVADDVQENVKLFAQGVSPQKTQNTQRSSFVADIQGNLPGTGIRLFFYDLAGELYNDERKMSELLFFDLMDETIILVDPFTIPEIRSRYEQELRSRTGFDVGDGDFDQNVSRIKNGLVKYEYRNYEYEYRDSDKVTHPYMELGQKLSARCAVVITKTDAFELDALAGEQAIQNALLENPHWNYEKAMHEVCLRQLENWGLGNSLRNLQEIFREVRCFSVSSFGHMPESGQFFVPQRVELPLNWLLAEAALTELAPEMV